MSLPRVGGGSSRFEGPEVSLNSLFFTFSQQDAQEFLRFLLDGLHNEVNRVTARPKSNTENLDHLP